MDSQQNAIPYDRMKEQIEKEILAMVALTGAAEMPRISFEKGTTLISFPVPLLNEGLIFRCESFMKDHLENVRVHGFGDGYYAFQALNRNLFKTENLLDNFKLELFGLSASFRVDISRKGDLSQDEITLVVGIYRVFYQRSADDPVAALRKLGASVFLENNELDWNYIAGYEDVKRRIRESVVLPLQNPELYDEIARMTRRTFESNRPRAILFEGPPGVEKTTVARILAGDVRVRWCMCRRVDHVQVVRAVVAQSGGDI